MDRQKDMSQYRPERFNAVLYKSLLSGLVVPNAILSTQAFPAVAAI